MALRSYILALSLLLIAGPAAGQAVVPDPLPLAEALAIARDHNPAYRAALARQRLELARQKYEIGTATFEELRTVTDDAFAREHAVITARHSFAIALIALQEAVGTGIR